MNTRLRRLIAAVVLIGALAGSSKGLTQKSSHSTKLGTTTNTVDSGGRSF